MLFPIKQKLYPSFYSKCLQSFTEPTSNWCAIICNWIELAATITVVSLCAPEWKPQRASFCRKNRTHPLVLPPILETFLHIRSKIVTFFLTLRCRALSKLSPAPYGWDWGFAGVCMRGWKDSIRPILLTAGVLPDVNCQSKPVSYILYIYWS